MWDKRFIARVVLFLRETSRILLAIEMQPAAHLIQLQIRTVVSYEQNSEMFLGAWSLQIARKRGKILQDQEHFALTQSQ